MANAYLDDPEVERRIEGLRAHFADKPLRVSDVVDGAGRQYVDLVMEGGGVLGVALLGYIHALESVGVRFMGVAGTSAGAITATLLSFIDSPSEAKAGALTERLCDAPMLSFVDGGWRARRTARLIGQRAGLIALAPMFVLQWPKLRRTWGLNPGAAFEEWVAGELRRLGVVSGADVSRVQERPIEGLRLVSDDSRGVSGLAPRWKVIAADITTMTRIEFPTMAELYFEAPDSVNPARYVRASMAVPVFFEPVRLTPPDGRSEKWQEHARYGGGVPKNVVVVDGGVMSNFPIDVFHNRNAVPRMPTFGVKLGRDRVTPQKLESIKAFPMGLFNATRHYANFAFLWRNPDYEHLVAKINTEETGVHWLDFALDEAKQLRLFRAGVAEACEFLAGFDWEGYKRIRRDLLSVM